MTESGVVAALYRMHTRPMHPTWEWRAYVYIMTNRPNGILYVGVTNNIVRRALEHREGLLDGFTRRYGLKRLVWYEPHQTMVGAIQREKNIKHWPRAWKVRTILTMNPDWEDLYETLA